MYVAQICMSRSSMSSGEPKLLSAFCVLPQRALSEHFNVNLHEFLIRALSFNFAVHRQLRYHAVGSRHSCPPCLYTIVIVEFHHLCRVGLCVAIFIFFEELETFLKTIFSYVGFPSIFADVIVAALACSAFAMCLRIA